MVASTGGIVLEPLHIALGRMREGERRFTGARDARSRQGALHPAPRRWPMPLIGARVHAFGSCFARELEYRLSTAGASVAHWVPPGDLAEAAGADRWRPNAVLNVMAPGQIAQWIDVGFGRSMGEDGLYEAEDGWSDTLLTGNDRLARGPAMVRRERIARHYAMLPVSHVALVSLETNECVTDLRTTTRLMRVPPSALQRADPGRFAFESMDVSGCAEALRGPFERLVRAGVNVVLMVSPMPLTTTAAGEAVRTDALIKATLRIAAEELSAIPGVHYFPAFEIVRSQGQGALMEDGLHVRADVLDALADSMLTDYAAPGVADPMAKRTVAVGDRLADVLVAPGA